MSDLFGIVPLERSHDRTTFSCGVPALDRYLRQQVGQDVRRRVASCFVAVELSSGRLVGYYTIAAASLPLSEVPHTLGNRLPRYSSVPAVLLGRLAVAEDYKGRKLGAALAADAIDRATRSDLAAAFMVTDAKDGLAQSFYEHLGFVLVPASTRRLILPLV